MKLACNGLLCLYLLGLLPAVAADTVSVPVGRQAAEMRHLDVPRRGMSKPDVEASFGVPRDKSTSVGEPPISYWDFEHYVVYFENDRVLHTVFKLTDSER